MVNSELLLDCAEKFGTPLYVYSADDIKQQYESLLHAFPTTNIRIKYACKALTNIHILRYIQSLGSGVDAVSLEEIQLALRAGFTPDDIIFTPNCVGFDEIQEAVKLGVLVNIDDLSLLEMFGSTYHNSVPCCVRINPHIVAGGNRNIQVGHIDSKFGISFYQQRHLLRIIEQHSINVVGIHMHTGSDILDASMFLRGAEILFEAARQLPDLQFVDFGSGFKVSYKEGDYTTNIQEFGQLISEAFELFCAEYGRPLELWFEPGKYIVSTSGSLLVKTNVVKQTVSTIFAGVNSGQNHLIRPMFYDAYHHITNLSNQSGPQRVYSVVGYICETDTFGWDRMLNEVRVGDILCIHNAGAYGFAMSSNYNSRLRPAEVFVVDGEPYCIRRRETIDDIMVTQSDLPTPLPW